MSSTLATSVSGVSTFREGDAAVLRVAPRREYQKLVGKPCRVLRIQEEAAGGRYHQVAVIQVDNGTEQGVTIRDVFLGFLSVPPPETPKRRSPARLKEPKDTRSESERLDEGVRWLETCPDGFGVMRVGQGRASAICHKCSRESRERGGPAMVRIVCKTCGSQGYSPSTNSTDGTPDTLVYRQNWPKAAGLFVEWKDGPSGKRSPEQARLEALGRIVVVWNLPTLLTAVHDHERRILPDPAARSAAVIDWLRQHDLLPAEETPHV